MNNIQILMNIKLYNSDNSINDSINNTVNDSVNDSMNEQKTAKM